MAGQRYVDVCTDSQGIFHNVVGSPILEGGPGAISFDGHQDLPLPDRPMFIRLAHNGRAGVAVYKAHRVEGQDPLHDAFAVSSHGTVISLGTCHGNQSIGVAALSDKTFSIALMLHAEGTTRTLRRLHVTEGLSILALEAVSLPPEAIGSSEGMLDYDGLWPVFTIHKATDWITHPVADARGRTRLVSLRYPMTRGKWTVGQHQDSDRVLVWDSGTRRMFEVYRGLTNVPTRLAAHGERILVGLSIDAARLFRTEADLALYVPTDVDPLAQPDEAPAPVPVPVPAPVPAPVPTPPSPPQPEEPSVSDPIDLAVLASYVANHPLKAILGGAQNTKEQRRRNAALFCNQIALEFRSMGIDAGLMAKPEGRTHVKFGDVRIGADILTLRFRPDDIRHYDIVASSEGADAATTWIDNGPIPADEFLLPLLAFALDPVGDEAPKPEQPEEPKQPEQPEEPKQPEQPEQPRPDVGAILHLIGNILDTQSATLGALEQVLANQQRILAVAGTATKPPKYTGSVRIFGQRATVELEPKIES